MKGNSKLKKNLQLFLHVQAFAHKILGFLLECHTSCSHCTAGNAHSCTSCPHPSVLYNGQCLDRCPHGFHVQDQTCHGKDSPCLLSLTFIFLLGTSFLSKKKKKKRALSDCLKDELSCTFSKCSLKKTFCYEKRNKHESI